MKDPDEQPDDFEEALEKLSPEDLKRTLEETYLEMHAHALLGEGTPLRFPPEVGERVEAYRKERAIILDELIPRAVAAQVDRVDEVLNTVHRLRKDPGSFEWPIEDPLLCVSIAFMRECMEWWLNKLNEEDGDEDSEDDDQADSWKEDEAE
jgi:hypothetical protein